MKDPPASYAVQCKKYNVPYRKNLKKINFNNFKNLQL
ncbi:Uncharacterised protein [Elizabethkingia meningoseptica]|nr:Uncharacterised protein [Elizabethkingia meningoseptica]